MPNADEGTVTTGADAAASASKPSPLAGFSGTMPGWSDPAGAVSGNPEKVEAVETDAKVEAPEVKKEEAPAKAAEPAKTEDKPADAKPVNFDGFSDAQKATWERLLKAGYATPDEVEAARKDSLRQNLFTVKTTKLAREREAFEAEKAKLKEDIALLERIRSDDRAHAAWLRMSRGEMPADESEGDLVDAKKAAEIARKVAEDLKSSESKSKAAEQEAFDTKQGRLQEVVTETIRTLGIDPKVMNDYLALEAEAFPEGVDPVKYAVEHISPSELRKALVLRHDAESAKAEAAKLREQLNQKTSKAVQASKQSLAPARRTVDDVHKTGLSKVLADLGVARLSDVPGFGHPDA